MKVQHERRLSERKAPKQLTNIGLPSGNSANVPNFSKRGFGIRGPLVICVSATALVIAAIGYGKATTLPYAYTIRSPQSNLSSRPATTRDVFEKTKIGGVPTKAAQPSSGAIKANAADALLKSLLDPGAVILQAGAFGQEANARTLTDSLRQRNFPAVLWITSKDTIYRVLVGPYADEESARIDQTELSKAGFKTFIRR